MTGHDIPYFRNLWQENILDLENHCKEWEKVCSDFSIPDDVHGEIRTAMGLARLLMNQKLKQFKGLIDDSEYHTGEKEVTCSDLDGFWDMVYYEVKKIQKSFERLNKCKNNDWKFVDEVSENHIKKIPVKKDITAINKKKEVSKVQMLAARQRIAEIKKKMAAEHRDSKNKNQVDILLFNKKELAENNTDYGVDMDIILLNDKTGIREPNEKRKLSHKISNKINMPAETNDFLEESSELSSASKQKSIQKKKHATANKENIFLDKDSSDFKHTPVKHAKWNEPEKTKNKPEFMKLQCVTRSAAKKALLQQQNSLQK